MQWIVNFPSTLSHFILSLSFSRSLTRNNPCGGVEPFLASPPFTTLARLNGLPSLEKKPHFPSLLVSIFVCALLLMKPKTMKCRPWPWRLKLPFPSHHHQFLD